MNVSKPFFLSPFAAVALSLALAGISQAQNAPSTGTAPKPNAGTASTPGTASAPGTAATQSSSTAQSTVETRGTQGAAGGSAPGLIPIPDLPTTGLADVRERDASNSPELTLEAAVLEALTNNPTPKAARAQLQASLARIGQARAVGRPTANLGANTNYQRTSGGNSGNSGTVVTTPGTGGTGTGGTGTGTGGTGTGGTGTTTTTGGGNDNSSRTDQLSLNISLPIFTGGRVKNSTRQAQALARAQLATAQQTEQELAAQTILGYLSVLQNGELLTVAQSNLDTSREQRRIAGVRFDAGAAARLEVLNADATLASAAQRRVAAANNAAQAKAALNILLARNPETPLRVQPITTLQLPTAVNFPLAAQANAIANGETAPTSPELRAAAEATLPSLQASRETVTASEYGVGVQKAQRKPSISASLGDLLRNPATFVSRFVLSAGLSVAQTLFSGGRIASQVAESEASLGQSRFNLDGRRLQTANAIEGSLLSLDSALKRTTSADVAVISAREALRAAQLSYSAGAGTQLDVANAQNVLVSAQTDAVNARYQVAQAQVQLAAATAVTTSGSATGNSGLGSSAGTGQNSSFSASGANQTGGSNTGTNTGTNSGTTQFGGNSSSGTGTGNNNGGFNTGTGN